MNRREFLQGLGYSLFALVPFVGKDKDVQSARQALEDMQEVKQMLDEMVNTEIVVNITTNFVKG